MPLHVLSSRTFDSNNQMPKYTQKCWNIVILRVAAGARKTLKIYKRLYSIRIPYIIISFCACFVFNW